MSDTPLLPASLPDWVEPQRFARDTDRYGWPPLERVTTARGLADAWLAIDPEYTLTLRGASGFFTDAEGRTVVWEEDAEGHRAERLLSPDESEALGREVFGDAIWELTHGDGPRDDKEAPATRS